MQKSCSGTRKPRQPEGLELNRASPFGPVGPGCQSRHGDDETTSELAAKKIGRSDVEALAGEPTVTGCGAKAAIVPWCSKRARPSGD